LWPKRGGGDSESKNAETKSRFESSTGKGIKRKGETQDGGGEEQILRTNPRNVTQQEKVMRSKSLKKKKANEKKKKGNGVRQFDSRQQEPTPDEKSEKSGRTGRRMLGNPCSKENIPSVNTNQGGGRVGKKK